MKREFNLRQIRYRSRISVPVEFKGAQISTELWCDFFVESCLTVSVHSMAALAPIHSAQMLAYMKLLGAPKGIIVNLQPTDFDRHAQ
ncbi:MAG TPA: GxxExxY protein, partial [Pyrinomonadaceae bacterium]|nr:GxxExxY protein [Pyrinomonadaceae bacterium]